jgi:hypothetical protein
VNAPFEIPPGVDFLAQAIECLRPHLNRSRSLKKRAHVFWSGVASVADLAATDVVETEFYQLAIDTSLHADFGKRADETITHLLRWGLRNQNPFR